MTTFVFEVYSVMKKGTAVLAGLGLVLLLSVPVARAQDPTPAIDNATQDDSGGDAISLKTKTPPLDVAGPWCGSIQDNALGSGEITVAIKQKGSKLGGTWTDNFGGFGTLSGKIKGTALTAKLHDKASKCKIVMNGILVNPGEVSGTYSQFGCHQADGGSFDITSPIC